MLSKSVPCHFFPFCTRLTVIAVRINGNSAAWEKFSPYFDIFRLHKLNKVIHNDVNAVLVEISVIAEAEQVELQGFALDHLYIGHIGNIDRRKIRLSGDGAKAGEFRAVELDKIVTVRVLVVKGFEHLRRVILRVFHILVSKQGDILHCFFVSAHGCVPFCCAVQHN